MDLVCRLTSLAGSPVLQVGGEIDLATMPLLRDQLSRAIAMHAGRTVYADLDGVTALDDTGLGCLLGCAGRAREQGGDLVLICTSARLLERFALTGLDCALTVQPGVALPRT